MPEPKAKLDKHTDNNSSDMNESRIDELLLFRSLLDCTSDAIFIVDTFSGNIIDASGATQSILGCESQTLKGQPFHKLLPNHIARYSRNLFNSRNEHLRLETEFCCQTCEGPGVHVEMSLRVAELNGRDLAIIVARDISDRKRIENVLRKNHDELEIRVRERTRELNRANRAKTEFLSMVSHELRTPLTSVLGFAKICRKKLQDSIFPSVDKEKGAKLDKEMERIEMNLDIIISEGSRLTSLINDVLDLAKMEADRVEYRMESVSPNDFIAQSINATNPLFLDSGLTLVTDIQPDIPDVPGDADRLVQVMVNLISNSVKFTEKGTITIRARQVEEHIRVSVTDTGMGIPEDLVDTIFDKFTQLESGLADRPKGSGLGLSISRNIIEGHQGHIWVESAPDFGSKFIFTLPAKN